MHEQFHAPTPEKSEHGEARKEFLKGLEKIETARQLWIQNIQILDEKIPHDDIMVDNMTLSYNVYRNAMVAHLDKLEHDEQEAKEELKKLN